MIGLEPPEITLLLLFLLLHVALDRHIYPFLITLFARAIGLVGVAGRRL